jgi:hypothetical protein
VISEEMNIKSREKNQDVLRPWEKVKIKGGMHNYIILSNY